MGCAAAAATHGQPTGIIGRAGTVHAAGAPTGRGGRIVAERWMHPRADELLAELVRAVESSNLAVPGGTSPWRR